MTFSDGSVVKSTCSSFRGLGLEDWVKFLVGFLLFVLVFLTSDPLELELHGNQFLVLI